MFHPFASATSLGASWLGFGFGILLKSLMLLVLTWIATLVMRRASAAVRHGIWMLGFLSLLALPIASLFLPAWNVPIAPELVASPSTNESTAVAAPPREVAEAGRAARGPLPSSRPRDRQTAAAVSWPWTMILVAVWLAGSFVLGVRLLIGFGTSRVMAHQASALGDERWAHLLDELSRELGVGRYVRLLQSRRLVVPVTCGVFHPKVLLPADAAGWSEPRRRNVLLHELGHIRRHDCTTHLVSQFVCAAYWWNPLVWFASRQMRQESERACDDLVLDAGTRASDYAHDLLDMARALNVMRRCPLASVTLAHRSRFEDRLLSILDTQADRTTWSGVKVIFSVAGAIALLVPIAALQPTTRAYAGRSLPPQDFGQSATSAPVAGRSRQEESNRPTPNNEDSRLNRRAVAALMVALDDAEPSVREQAVEVLARLKYAPAVEPVIEALRDDDARVREAASRALGLMADARAVGALLEALRDEVSHVREQAAWSLGTLRDPQSIEALNVSLGDGDPGVREQAAWALGMIQDERSAEALAHALEDEDADVREQAAWALGMIRHVESVPVLLEGLNDDDPDVREQSAWALGMIRGERASAGLAAALRGQDADVREQAAWALGMLRAPDAAAALIGSLSDIDSDVRQQAAWALGMIGSDEASEALQAAMKDEDPDVREQAAWALGMIAMR